MRLQTSFFHGFLFSLISSLAGFAIEASNSSNIPWDVPDNSVTFTIFNGVKVPPLLEIQGNQFSSITREGYWFVKHFSPWCPHCTAIAPIWQTLYEFYYTSTPVESASFESKSFSHSNFLNDFSTYYNFHFGSLDCDAYGTTCNSNKIKSYPTFILFKDGKEISRLGAVGDMKGISDFIETHLESIRPGSRPKGGLELPEVGSKGTKSIIDEAVRASNAVTAIHHVSQSPSTASSTSKEVTKNIQSIEKQNSKNSGIKSGNKISIPNPLGTSLLLSTEKFQRDVTMSQDPWLIKFYVPWCGHCQAMAPIWIQLAKEMKGRLNIGEVNCDTEHRLCKDVQTQGYPTILFFRGGERVEYIGLRGLGDFVAYANKAIEIEDGVKDIDASEFEELEKTEEVIFVYFYDHATTSEDFAALERLTVSLIGHAKLVKTNCKILTSRFKITTWPRLLVSRDGRPTYYTALSPQEMRDFRRVLHWMHSVWLPIVPELTASNSREIMNGKLVVLAILNRDRPDEFTMAKKEIKSAALEWMDKQTIAFQRERQELRDAKQLRIEEAEDRNDQRSLRAAKNIRISMDRSEQKEVGFAWVDGLFWERWIRQTYGIDVGKDGEKVIINDEDNRCFWDTTITGNTIIPSRTSILETIPKVVSTPPKIKSKSTISTVEKFFFDIRGGFRGHPFLSLGFLVALVMGTLIWGKARARRSRGGFFRLDDKDRLLSSGINGKVD